MSKILFNNQVSNDFFMMRASCENSAKPGQFYMLRAWDTYPVLSRPVSVYDADGQSVTFLYKVVGEGTKILSKQKSGGEITLQGPYGNAFPDLSGKVAMVGGGVGIAPLFYAAKRFKENNAGKGADLFLGFSGEAILVGDFSRAAERVVADVGGFITDKISPKEYDAVITCGPDAMMRALYKKCEAENVADRLHISLENRMACGIGACLVCSCATIGGNKKACKDGPVFKAGEVYGI